MAFSHTNSKGQTYYLHYSKVTLKGGYQRDIYYFSKAVTEEKALEKLPEGYEVSENKTTGLPLLRKERPVEEVKA